MVTTRPCRKRFEDGEFGFRDRNYPVNEAHYHSAMSLPMFARVTDAEQEMVVAQPKQALHVECRDTSEKE
jgi:hypothetical protein